MSQRGPLSTTGIVATTVVLLLLVAASIVRVTEPAYCGGRFLEPGLHLRLPLRPVKAYPAGPLEARAEGQVASRAAIESTFTVTLRYAWDLGRLSGRPVDPSGVPEVLARALAELDGRFADDELGRRVAEDLAARLAELPFQVMALDAVYPGTALEGLRAAARETGERLVVIGFDGLDWGLLDPMIAAGRLPVFARLKRQGAWAELVSHPPVLSPLLWTSIATGRDPETHGIVDFVVSDADTGRDLPITNRYRRVHAFWNILSLLRRRVNVVNWWATHPAESIHGVMVSERPFYQLFGIETASEDPANVFPPGLLDEVTSRLVSVEDVGYDEVRRFAEIPREVYDRAVDSARGARNPFDHRLNHLRKILATTRGVFEVGHWLLEEHPADLLALYVEGTDTIGHRFAHFLPPRLPWVGAQDFAAYRDTMPRFYQECDRQLGRLMDAAPGDVTWMVITDHGFFTGRARPKVPPDDFVEGAGRWHRMVGAFLATGPHVKPGKIPRADIYDLARTLLWLQGAPISRELLGRELVELMDPEWVKDHPPVYANSYAGLDQPWLRASEAPAADVAEIDDQRLKELEALGYLAAGERLHSATPADSPAATGALAMVDASAARKELASGSFDEATETKPTALLNRAILARRDGDVETAIRLLEEAIEAKPDFMFGMLELYGIHAAEGNATQALLWLGKALRTDSPRLPPQLPVGFVRAAIAAGRLDGAFELLEQMPARWLEVSSYHAARALALRELGRLDEALAALQASLARNPADLDALAVVLEGAAVDPRVAVDPLLEPAFAALRTDLDGLKRLARLCLRHGQPAWAERLLRDVLESAAADTFALRHLARALAARGAHRERVEVLERLLIYRPENARDHFELGRALAALGRHDQARASYARARELGLDDPELEAAEAAKPDTWD